MSETIDLATLYTEVNHKVELSQTDKVHFDFIVIGVGTMGAATAFNLASLGYSVLGIEQFKISHEHGSHAGQSRLIRQAYFEHPDYVPLLKLAYKNWHAIEEKSSSKLYYPTGILYAGLSDDFLIKGSLKSAEEHQLPLERISKQQLHHRYPQFAIPDDYDIILEHNAGFITPERAILTYVNQSLQQGAEVHTQEKALAWQQNEGSIKITTDKNTYTCNKLIITAGAWSSEQLPQFEQKLEVTRQFLAWITTTNDERFTLNHFPCWGINQKDFPGLFYGFPIVSPNQFGGPTGMKIGYHLPGQTIEPDAPDIKASDADIDILVDFLKKFIPGSYKNLSELKSCKYTYSPDEHFIIDFHSDTKNVVFAAGFSGHGFKFAPAIGEILADLATEGKTSHPIGFLAADRFTA